MADKWYKTGKEGMEESARRDAQMKAKAAQRENQRFKQYKDSTTKIIYLDTPSFFLAEHKITLAGDYDNFFTCLNDFDECPLCLDGDNSRYTVASTIIDTSSYTSAKGNVYKNQKKLLVAIGECRKNTLKEIAKRGGNLEYCVYELSRGSLQGEPNTGSSFNFLKKADRVSIAKWLAKQWQEEGKEFAKKYIEIFLAPFDYAKIFAPKSAAELRKLVGMATPLGGADVPEDAKEIDSENEPEDLDALL